MSLENDADHPHQSLDCIIGQPYAQQMMEQEQSILKQPIPIFTMGSDFQKEGQKASLSPSDTELQQTLNDSPTLTSSSMAKERSTSHDVEVWQQKVAQLEATVSKLQGTLQTLEHQAHLQITQERRDKQEWQAKALQNEAKCRRAELELVEIRTKARTLAMEARDTMEASRQEHQAMVDKLRQEMNGVQERWQLDKDSLLKDKETLLHDKLTLQRELEEFESKHNAQNEKQRQLEMRLQSQKEDIEHKDGLISSLQNDMQELSDERSNFAQANEDLQSRLAKSQEQQIHASEQIQALQQRVEEKTKETLDLKAAAHSISLERDTVAQQVTLLTATKSKHETELGVLRDKITSLNQELLAANAQMRDLESSQNELQQTKAELASMEKAVEAKTADIEHLHEELRAYADMERQLQDLTQERNSLRIQIEQNRLDLQQRLAQFSDEKAQLNLSFSQLEESADKQLKQATETIDDLQNQLRSAKDQLEQKRESLEKGKQKLNELKTSHIATVEQLRSDSDQKKEYLEAEIDKLKLFMQQQQEEHKLSLSAVLKEKQLLAAKIEELMATGKATAEQLQESACTIESLNEAINQSSLQERNLVEKNDELEAEIQSIRDDKSHLEQTLQARSKEHKLELSQLKALHQQEQLKSKLLLEQVTSNRGILQNELQKAEGEVQRARQDDTNRMAALGSELKQTKQVYETGKVVSLKLQTQHHAITEALEQTKQAANDDMATLQAKHDAMCEELERTQQCLQSSNKDWAALEARCLALDDELAKSKEQLVAVDKKYASMLAALEATTAELESQLEQARTEQVEMTMQHEDENRIWDEKSNTLRSHHFTLKLQLDERIQSMREAQEKYGLLESSLADFENVRVQSNDCGTMRMSVATHLKEAKVKGTKTVTTMEQERQLLTDEIESLQPKHQEMQTKINTTRESIQTGNEDHLRKEAGWKADESASQPLEPEKDNAKAANEQNARELTIRLKTLELQCKALERKLLDAIQAAQLEKEQHAKDESSWESLRASMERELQQEKDGLDQLEKYHQTESSILESKVLALEEQSQNARNLSKPSSKGMQRLVKERQSAIIQNEEAEKGLFKVQSEMDRLKTQLSELEIAGRNASIEATEAKEFNLTLCGNFDNLPIESGALLETKKALKASFEGSRQSIKVLKDEMAAHKMKATQAEHRFEKERSSLQNQVTQLEIAIDLKSNDIEDLVVSLQKAEIEIINLKQDHKDVAAVNERLMAHVAELEDKISKEKGEETLTGVKEDFKSTAKPITDRLGGDKADVTKTCQSLMDEKQRIEDELGEAQTKMKSMTEKIIALELAVDEKTKLFEDTQKRLEAVEDDNEELEKQIQESLKSSKPFWLCG